MPRRALYAFQGDRDQVVRLNEFKAANPQWDVSFDYDHGTWRGRKNVENGVDFHVRHHLRDPLDLLEDLEQPPTPRGSADTGELPSGGGQ